MRGILFLSLFLAVSSFADYEVYQLPKIAPEQIPQKETKYTTQKYSLAGGSIRTKAPSVNANEYIFAKEAFVSEKRDEAIKLLRQEIDSGYKKNLDNVLLRLGQLYVEKYMELNYLESQYHAEKLKEWSALEKKGQKAKKVPQPDHSRSKKYLTLALKTFNELEKKYPKFEKMDEVWFFIGFVQMEAGNHKPGSAYLEKLVKTYKRSRKYPEALLYLADFYFEKSRFKEAYEKYQTILKLKDENLATYARYKNAWCELNLGSEKKALNLMKALIDDLEGQKGDANFNLREQALKDVVVFFAELEMVEESMEYFTDKIGREKALENLKLIAGALLAKNKDVPAQKAYLMLVKEFGQTIDGPRYHLALYESHMRLSQYKQAVGLMQRMILTYNYGSDWADTWLDKKKDLAVEALGDVEKEAVNSAYFFHQTAQKTKSKEYYEYALSLYQAVVDGFPKTEDARKFVFFQAEILYKQEKWLKAADVYMKVANAKVKDKYSEESLYNALLSVDNLTQKSATLKRYTKEEMKNMDLKKSEIPEEEEKFIEIANQYLERYPKVTRAVDVRFRIASIYYKHKHFDEALKYFDAIASNHPRHQSAKTAAYVSLDIYNIRKDFDGLSKASLRFAQIPGLADKKFEEEMGSLRSEIAFKKIEVLEKDKKWKEAGAEYVKFYKKNPSSPLAQKALYNAVVSYERSDDKTTSNEVSSLFLKRYPTDPYSKGLLLKQAKEAERTYEFARAQDLYFDYYQKFPKDDQAKAALYNAAVFASILSQYNDAITRFKMYLALKPTKEEVTAINKTLTSIYEKSNNWGKVAEAYSLMYREADTNKEKAEVLSLQADLYERNGRRSDRVGIMGRLKQLTGNSGGGQSWGFAVRHVAEIRFADVEREKKAYDRIVLAFPVDRLAARIKQKQKALIRLNESYDKIVQLGVPEWGVAALAEKSQAYDRFVEQYRSLKLPGNLKPEEKEILEKELATLDKEMIEPLKNKATEVYQTCREKAQEFLVVSDFASECFQAGGKAVADTRPSGLVPQPAYWTTSWVE